MNEASSLPFPHDDSTKEGKSAGRGEEIRWEVVAETSGMAPAQIIVGRLQTEGIPARAWQEGAGRAIGLVVGPLGTARVVVPEEFAEKALAILADVDEASFDEESSEDDF